MGIWLLISKSIKEDLAFNTSFYAKFFTLLYFCNQSLLYVKCTFTSVNSFEHLLCNAFVVSAILLSIKTT